MMTATQKINLAAFDVFMLLILSARQRFRIFLFKTKTQLTLCDSAPEYCAGASKKRKQNV
ncbi:MAG TPA: hypothetical protein VGM65_08110 [Candidatus Udaeobacter sp.]|jgi:hypothetical protein